jgi:hypothetical protein
MKTFRQYLESRYDAWKLASPGDDYVNCPACDGHGKVDDETCELCKGSGEVDSYTAREFHYDNRE